MSVGRLTPLFGRFTPAALDVRVKNVIFALHLCKILSKMKKILLTTLLALVSLTVFAQKGTVTAKVLDGETGETVIGAELTDQISTSPLMRP